MSENERSNGGRRIKEMASDLSERAHDAAEAAREAAGTARDRAEAALGVAVDYAEDGLDEAYQFVKRQLRDRPLAVAGTALGLGLLIGLALSNRRR